MSVPARCCERMEQVVGQVMEEVTEVEAAADAPRPASEVIAIKEEECGPEGVRGGARQEEAVTAV